MWGSGDLPPRVERSRKAYYPFLNVARKALKDLVSREGIELAHGESIDPQQRTDLECRPRAERRVRAARHPP